MPSNPLTSSCVSYKLLPTCDVFVRDMFQRPGGAAEKVVLFGGGSSQRSLISFL